MFDWLRVQVARARVVQEALREVDRSIQRAKQKHGNYDLMTTVTELQRELSEIQAEMMEARRALMATQAELVKAQIVAATRLDTIRLLGLLASRNAPDVPEDEMPSDPASRALLALELQELAAHVRERAERFDKVAAALDAGQPG